MNEASFENKHNLRKAETANEFEAVMGGNFESQISKLSLYQSPENMGIKSGNT